MYRVPLNDPVFVIVVAPSLGIVYKLYSWDCLMDDTFTDPALHLITLCLVD